MYRYLDDINSPLDLKKLSESQLEVLCTEIRDYIVRCCSVNPGHLGSSLGAVELIVAMHYVFDAPHDKFVFDVGHQAYAHKIITGRREIFRQNRKKDGISGFPNRFESEYDAFGAGHSSTSISAALGLAKAAQMQGIDQKVIALIGDGAMTGGLAFEAMNNVHDNDVLVILNDNNQSIDKNIGSFHDYLLKITTDPTYNKIKRHIWDYIGEGRFRSYLQNKTRATKTNLVRDTGGDLFESLGFRYFGPIDGNNLSQVIGVLKRMHDISGPKLLHVHTVKGKGYAPAEADPTVWHAPGKFNPETGERISSPGRADRYQDVFGEVLLSLARMDKRVVGITPAMATGCGMSLLASEMPERFFDVGIEEEHAVTFSAGLAAGGMKPFCNIYSSFSQRAYDQIVHDVALQKLPVVLCFDRGGLVGEDGATHHGCFDMAAYRSIPGTVICAPRNELELKNLMYTGLNQETGPFIIRYPRGCGEGVSWRDEEFRSIAVGKGGLLRRGREMAILTLGPVASSAVEAAGVYAAFHKLSPAVFDMRFLKPIDTEILDFVFSSFSMVLTVEDGAIKGGLFSEVTEMAAQCGYSGRISGIGIPDRFIGQDTQAAQKAECGLDMEGILNRISEMDAGK